MVLSAKNVATLDSFVRDWLLLRGFKSTLASMEEESSNDPTFGLNPSLVASHLLDLASSTSTNDLLTYWSQLNSIFSQVPTTSVASETLHISVIRVHLAHCFKLKRNDLVLSFFKSHPSLASDHRICHFFTASLSPDVSDESIIHWQAQRTKDLLSLSISNFLSTLFQSLDLPPLLSHLNSPSPSSNEFNAQSCITSLAVAFDSYVAVGTQNGSVYCIDKDFELVNQWKLSNQVTVINWHPLGNCFVAIFDRSLAVFDISLNKSKVFPLPNKFKKSDVVLLDVAFNPKQAVVVCLLFTNKGFEFWIVGLKMSDNNQNFVRFPSFADLQGINQSNLKGSISFNHNGSLIFVSINEFIFVFDSSTITTTLDPVLNLKTNFIIQNLILLSSETSLIAWGFDSEADSILNLVSFSLTAGSKNRSIVKSKKINIVNFDLANVEVTLTNNDYLLVIASELIFVSSDLSTSFSESFDFSLDYPLIAICDPSKNRLFVGSSSGHLVSVKIPNFAPDNNETKPCPPPPLIS
ncbi:hypothetical protein P9112_012389 [Eukaryota sp. TZLM1-RC]